MSEKTEVPVRSPELKLRTAGLVLQWVTIREQPVLQFCTFYFFNLILVSQREQNALLHFKKDSWRIQKDLMQRMRENKLKSDGFLVVI